MRMLDNDRLTYSQPKARANNTAERTLLTPDRSQKLDLLIHLLTNLQQSLIVCGPEGIGKTTLLQTLFDSHKDLWSICRLQGSPALSFETVMVRLSQNLNLSGANQRFDMSALRAYCEKQKVIVAIDDASELVPGLMGELMDFADSLSGLRLVFAMNNEDFQQKASSDSAIDECHLIELPPLNQRQCLEYLQNLSAQPGVSLSFNAITDALVAELYEKTQGIPGKLLAELPKIDQYQQQQRKLGLWLGIGLIVAIAGFVGQNLIPTEQQTAQTAPSEPTPPSSAPAEPPPLAAPAPATALMTEIPVTEQEIPAPASALATPALPAPILEPATRESTGADTSRPAAVSPLAPAVAPPPVPAALPANKLGTKTPTPAPAQVPVPTPAPAALPAAEKPKLEPTKPEPSHAAAATPAKPPETATPSNKNNSNDDDADWIQAQPATNYTVQIMVLSSKVSVNRFMKKYAEYHEQLKYYRIGAEGAEKYVLIYGSFASSIDALNNKSDMPPEFSQGLIKRFKFIQRESRR